MCPPSDFVAHGSSRFEARGQVLILHSVGPFNAEHILSLAEPFRYWAARLRQDGPWASVNVVTASAMCTPEAIQALRVSAQRSFDLLGRDVGLRLLITDEQELTDRLARGLLERIRSQTPDLLEDEQALIHGLCGDKSPSAAVETIKKVRLELT